jgi:hypothetical protein
MAIKCHEMSSTFLLRAEPHVRHNVIATMRRISDAKFPPVCSANSFNLWRWSAEQLDRIRISTMFAEINKHLLGIGNFKTKSSKPCLERTRNIAELDC